MNEDEAYIAGRVPAGNVFVDGLSVGGVGHVVIRDRQLLARDGILLVVVSIDKQSGQIMAGPDIVTRGFVYAAEASELLDNTKERVRNALAHQNGDTAHEWNYVNKKIRETVSQYLYDQTKRRPMVLPVVMEI